ncbi:hypothetical protein [Litorimonas sp. WD9-15]|uniref:hypothetical protein n=1 Tax=Litorimonas sp. WD9-15 TaxID=3418716 RepID=UPI003D0481BC
MTFRTIDTDMETVGATTAPETGGITRRSRSARRSAILGSRTRPTRVWCYGTI